MTNLIDNRQIRVFISSTFRDMQDERDYLINLTFPKLRALAAERDVTLTEIDLRWGITEEESKSGKVVEICLKEIDNSIPFFIGIIGNRYGWIPSQEDIHSNENMNGKYSWVYNDIDSGLSVTEMEMQYAVLRRKDNVNAFFYIKDKENDVDCDHPEKLVKLKTTIKENGRYPFSLYHSIDELSEQVERDFRMLLDKVFPEEHSSDFEKETTRQKYILHQYSQNYVENPVDTDNLKEFLLDSSNDCLLITGETGSGKTALLANFIKKNVSDVSRRWIYYFTNSNSVTNPVYILKYWIKQLSSFNCGEPDNIENFDSPEELRNILEGQLKKSTLPVVLVLDDATSHHESDNWKLNTLDWFPCVKDGNKAIVSSSYSEGAFTQYKHEKDSTSECRIQIGNLTKEQIKAITENQLKDYGKSLSETQLEYITNFKIASNASVLTTLVDSIINYGSFEKLDSYIKSYVNASSKEEFYSIFIDNISTYFDEGVVEKTLMAIVTSEYGLSEDQIKEYVGVTPIVWSQLYCIFSKHFITDGYGLKIKSKDMYNAIWDKYEDNIEGHSLALIDFLERQLDTPELSKTTRTHLWDELCSQYYLMCSSAEHVDEMADRLYSLISQADVFCYLCGKRASKLVSFNANNKQIYKYWSDLHKFDSEKYSLTVYAEDNKFIDRDYLYQSSDLIDTAIHAEDYIGTIKIASKAIRLFRDAKDVPEEITKFFRANVIALSICARSWNLNSLCSELNKLEIMFDEEMTLPSNITIAEQCILAYAESLIEKDQGKKSEKLAFVISTISQFNSPYSDLSMLSFKMSQHYQNEGNLDNALTYIVSAKEYMDKIGGDYDDYNECFKAHLLGVHGLILKDMGHLEEAGDMIYDAIIKYEDIEDIRNENGDYRATIEYVEKWAEELDEIRDMLEMQN